MRVRRLKREQVMKKCGKFLGSGAYKSAYVLKESPDRVALVATFGVGVGNLRAEQKRLLKLKRLGFPTVKVYGLRPSWPALVVERMYVGSRDDDFRQNADMKLLRILGKKTIEGARAIRNLAQFHNIRIYDLQFLFDRAGRPFINDPLGVVSGFNDRSPMAHELYELEALAHYAMAWRRGEVTLGGGSGIKVDAKTWAQSRGLIPDWVSYEMDYD
jgi:hypothetical protein